MFKSVLAIIFACLFLHCLYTVEFVKRVPHEAEIVVIRDGEFNGDEVGLFIDSLLIGNSLENTVTTFTVPAGNHYILFEFDGSYSVAHLMIGEKEVIYIRQSFLDAYVFSYLKTIRISKELAEKIISEKKLTERSLKYYNASKKINTNTLHRLIEESKEKVRIGPNSIKIRIDPDE